MCTFHETGNLQRGWTRFFLFFLSLSLVFFSVILLLTPSQSQTMSLKRLKPHRLEMTRSKIAPKEFFSFLFFFFLFFSQTFSPTACVCKHPGLASNQMSHSSHLIHTCHFGESVRIYIYKPIQF